jgi:hypothetical protein
MFEYFDRRGIAIFGGASADLSSQGPMITTSANTIDGILLAENAFLRAGGGALTATQNSRDGITVTGNSIFSVLGAMVTFSANARRGMTVNTSQAAKLPPGTLAIAPP